MKYNNNMTRLADDIRKRNRIKNKRIEDGFTMSIYDWMLKLDLTQSEMLIYALIYQFSRPGSDTTFFGSLTFIQNSLNKDRKTIISALDTLEKCGLIRKAETLRMTNGVERARYAVVLPKMPVSRSHIVVNGWMFRWVNTTSELLVYAVIYSYSQPIPGCATRLTCKASYLAKETGLSERTLSRVLEALKDNNKIFIHKAPMPRKREYTALYPREAVELYNERNKDKDGFRPVNIAF